MGEAMNYENQTDVPGTGQVSSVVAETLVETLEDVSTQLLCLADGPGAVTAEEARFFAAVLNQAARVAAVTNMRLEELENSVRTMKELGES